MKEFRTSPKYIELARQFLQNEVKEHTYKNNHNSTEIFYSHALFEDKTEIEDTLTENVTLFKLLPYLSRQYKANDMILDIDWLGSEFGVYHEPSFGTEVLCCLQSCFF